MRDAAADSAGELHAAENCFVPARERMRPSSSFWDKKLGGDEGTIIRVPFPTQFYFFWGFSK